MALVYAKYERNESTLDSLGTVIDSVGKDGVISLIPKNFKDTSKRVVVVLTKKNGTSTAVTCSKQVSDGLRDQSITLGNVLGFEMLEGESGIPFISLPGGGMIEFKVKDLKVQTYESSAVDYENLISL